jgi:hypothetical protein
MNSRQLRAHDFEHFIELIVVQPGHLKLDFPILADDHRARTDAVANSP